MIETATVRVLAKTRVDSQARVRGSGTPFFFVSTVLTPACEVAKRDHIFFLREK